MKNVFKKWYVSFSYTGTSLVPGIRHTYKICVQYRSRIWCQGIYDRTGSIYLRNNKIRQQDDGVLSSPLSQGSDRGETPLFVEFSYLGNIVEQQWSPYRVYTHFLWHHVAEMIEPQSGTITDGLIITLSYTPVIIVWSTPFDQIWHLAWGSISRFLTRGLALNGSRSTGWWCTAVVYYYIMAPVVIQ